MPGWPIHTLVFDLDDTLFAEADFVRSGFRAVSEWLRETRGVEGFAQAAEALFKDGVRGTIFNVALQRLGQGEANEIVTELVQIYRAHTPRISLFPDAHDVLDWSRGRCRRALLSDGYQVVQQKKLAALGCGALFDSIIFTDSLGREFWKPHPEGFRRIAATLGGGAAGFVYVADNPRKDFIGPRGLGWRTVRVRRSAGEHAYYDPTPAEAAEREIESLTELKALVECVQ